MQGHQDVALNAVGLAQASALGRRFQKGRVDALYASDLRRAYQTAQPVAEATGCAPVTLFALRERNFGCCEGRSYAEILARSVEDARAIRERDPDYVPSGGESVAQFEQRVLSCVEALHRRHVGAVVVVVTHGGVLDVVHRRARCLPRNAARDYPVPNAGLNWVRIVGQSWTIERWGDVSHFSPDQS